MDSLQSQVQWCRAWKLNQTLLVRAGKAASPPMAGRDALSWLALGVLGTHIYDRVVLSLRSQSLYNS